MKTTCAYCYHEVEITKDGTCSYCGGNLAIKPITEMDKFEKTRLERIQDFLSIIPDPPTIMQHGYPAVISLPLVKELIATQEENQQSKIEKEMRDLNNYTKVIRESETVKDLVKSLTRPMFPFWCKFTFFLIGLILSSFYTFPFLQIPLLETMILINNSQFIIMFLSVIPIMFMLVILKKNREALK